MKRLSFQPEFQSGIGNKQTHAAMPILFIAILILFNSIFAQSFHWAAKLGGQGMDNFTDLATDDWSNVFLSGTYLEKAIQVDSVQLPNHGGIDILIAKFNRNGRVVWAQGIGGPGLEAAYGIDCDRSGNVFVAGDFNSSTLIFGQDTLKNADDKVDFYLAKLDSNGQAVWARSVGCSGYVEATQVTTDRSGNAYATGIFYAASVTFGDYVIPSSGVSGHFLVKYDPAGNVLWAVDLHDVDLNNVVVDSSGCCFLTGHFPNSVFTPGNQDQRGWFVAKCASNGSVEWTNGYGNDYDYGGKIALDSYGNIYVVGIFESDSLTIGASKLTNPKIVNKSSHNAFISKYDLNGVPLWAKAIEKILGPNLDNNVSLYGCDVDLSGNILAVGVFSCPKLVIGIDTLSKSGPTSLFLAKYDSFGNPVWAYSPSNSATIGIAFSALNNKGIAYIAGEFSNDQIKLDSSTLLCEGSSDIFLASLDTIFRTATSVRRDRRNGMEFKYSFQGRLHSVEHGNRIYNLLGRQLFTADINQDGKRGLSLPAAHGVYIESNSLKRMRRIIAQE